MWDRATAEQLLFTPNYAKSIAEMLVPSAFLAGAPLWVKGGLRRFSHTDASPLSFWSFLTSS